MKEVSIEDIDIVANVINQLDLSSSTSLMKTIEVKDPMSICEGIRYHCTSCRFKVLTVGGSGCQNLNLCGWQYFRDPREGFLCYVQGYSTQFFSVASFLWTTTIAFTLYRTVVKHKADVEEFGPAFHAYVWGTAFLMTIIPSIGDDYGPAGAWCWVRTETTAGKVLRFMTFYVPLWGAILFNGAVYFQVIRMLKYATRMAVSMADRQRQVEARPEMKAMNRWGYYPLILIASWTFGTINRIHDFVEPQNKLFWLYCLHISTASLMGLFNSIAYGLNAAVRRTLQERLDQWWPEKYRLWRPAFRDIEDAEELVPLEQKEGP